MNEHTKFTSFTEFTVQLRGANVGLSAAGYGTHTHWKGNLSPQHSSARVSVGDLDTIHYWARSQTVYRPAAARPARRRALINAQRWHYSCSVLGWHFIRLAKHWCKRLTRSKCKCTVSSITRRRLVYPGFRLDMIRYDTQILTCDKKTKSEKLSLQMLSFV